MENEKSLKSSEHSVSEKANEWFKNIVAIEENLIPLNSVDQSYTEFENKHDRNALSPIS